MARDPLADAVDVLVDALGGHLGRLSDRVHAIVTDALEEANSAEEAGDDLGTLVQTVAVLSVEVARTVATGLTGALGAAPEGSGVRIDTEVPVEVVASTPPNVLVETLIRALGADPADGPDDDGPDDDVPEDEPDGQAGAAPSRS